MSDHHQTRRSCPLLPVACCLFIWTGSQGQVLYQASALRVRALTTTRGQSSLLLGRSNRKWTGLYLT